MTFHPATAGLDAVRTPSDLGRRIARGLQDAVLHLRTIRLLSRQTRHLGQMDDRLLLDIGIVRGAIDHAVRLGR
jgi:uncharacterized protein YjiS (DUF1127 family)